MDTKNIIAGTLVVVAFAILLGIISINNFQNQRTEPRQVATSETVTSRLKDQSTENLPTSTEKFESLQSEVLFPGNTSEIRQVKTGDRITVNYRGWLASDGSIFDQSFNRGDAGFSFTVGQGVIDGWSEGVVGMQLGEIRRLRVPSAKGYAEFGSGEAIPANADLIFDVELIRFEE